MTRRLLVVLAAALGLLVFTSAAGATQLGITAQPSGSTPASCPGVVIGQLTQDSTTPYFGPAGGGLITQWQTNTAGDTAGTSITLVVLQPTTASNYKVVGLSTETLPTPLPSSGVASFTLSTPLVFAAGDTLALYSTSSYICYFRGGSTPTGDSLFATGLGAPTVGGTVTISGSTSGSGYTLNLGATFAPYEDASVQTSSFPSTTDVTGAALFQSVVTNAGIGTGPITFVDQVPSGLQVKSATTDAGTCNIAGQTVTCTVSGLSPGQSATVDVVVMATTAGSYNNSVNVSVGSAYADPNTANNSASASVTFTALPQKCIVPGLRKLTMASAKSLLMELGCKVSVAHKHSGLKKGLVMGTKPGVGTYPYQQVVSLIVSSGPKKHKHH